MIRIKSKTALRGKLKAATCMAAAVAVLTAGCASSTDDSSSGASDSGPISLYASMGVSGTGAAIQPALEAGIRAAVTAINDNGGLLGRPIEIEVQNNESDPTKAVSLLQARMNKSTPPDLVWAGTSSSEALALTGVTTRAKVMSFSPGNNQELGDASKFPYLFGSSPVGTAIADTLTDYLVEQGHKTVGILTPNDALGNSAADRYKAAFEKEGLTVATDRYETDAVAMDGPLARLADKKPDVVVFNAVANPAYVLKSRVKVGMENIPFVGDLSTTNVDYAETLNANEKEGVTLAAYTLATTATDRPGAKNLLDSLHAAGVTLKSSLSLYGIAYDVVLAYANAVESVGTMDVEKVRAAMEASAGDTYPLSLTDDQGWTEDIHLGSGDAPNYFTFIPVSPLVDGQFQLGS
ncbi:ABC transporter substrate-binding protein [Nocardia sp. 348MFTsu5.1]|uniref:ABC transporter substrate-binding protein n=1 Tax=Nocardia sp. 348MFTsu5.1 TaxID=1172185 RepID=UPI00038057F2|nr:ABC transporter substrate-binding protein [Nocardia sp. 348MFTsu5.1]